MDDVDLCSKCDKFYVCGPDNAILTSQSKTRHELCKLQNKALPAENQENYVTFAKQETKTATFSLHNFIDLMSIALNKSR